MPKDAAGRDVCPDTAGMRDHSPADKYGKCSWCGRKYTSAMPKPALRPTVSDLTLAYHQTYDPDFGSKYDSDLYDNYNG
jgi:hypothetical protein